MTDFTEAKARDMENRLLNLATRIRSGRRAGVSPADAELVGQAVLLIQSYRVRLYVLGDGPWTHEGQPPVATNKAES